MCRHSNIAAMSTMVPRYVLPTNVVPLHYGLAITPNIAAFTFKGVVDIVFQANSDNLLANGTANQAPASNGKCLVDHVTLNSAEITITKVSFTLPSDPGTPLFSITGDDLAQHVITEEKDDRVRIELPKKEAPLSLCIGDAFIVSIEYDGIINDKMHGFYRSGYTKETTAADGTITKEDCFMGTTQFEAADARRALPCYDEPSHKATFALSIAVPKAHFADERYRVLANTHETSREDLTGDDGVERVRVSFGTTPKMSTYLLAWTIGHFDVIERTIPKLHPHPADTNDVPIGVSTSNSTVVRIFAPPQDNKIAAGEFALDVACKVIPLYEKFMGSNYILDKCDLLAIPDFAAGAMENWGLITYRETALLYDPKRSSATSKQWVALVVAHELAHQWFGNLVTMQWWKELWLNESFATFVEYWAVDTLFPDWNIFTQFVNDEGSAAFSLDALKSSHPVEVDVEYAAQIDEIFDAISYSKGGSVLRMVVEYIGWDAFGNGLKKYLADFSFSNASTEDLWKYLGEAAGQPELAELLRVWTSVQGYPMLTVSPSTDKSGVNVSQKRFFADSASEDVENATWNLPLKYLNNGTTHRALITTKVADLPCEKADAFVKVNSNGAAFCRVKYQGGELLEKLIAGIKNGEVTNNIDRLTLISDYAAFAQGGYISAAEVISGILPAFSAEEDYTVWCAISKFESAVRATLFAGVSASDAADATEEQQALSAYNALCVNLYGGSAFKKLGIVPPADGEDHRLSQLRALLVARLCSAKDASTISAVIDTYWAPVKAAFTAAGADTEAAIKAAGEYLHNKVPADLQQCVISTAVLSDPSEAATGNYAIVKSLCKDSDASFRSRCLRALGSTTNPKLLAQTGTFAVVSGEVRSQDSFYALIGVAANNMGSPDGSAIPPAATAYVSALLIAEWATVMKKFPGMMSGRIVKFIEHLPPVEAVVQLLEVDFWEKAVPETDKASVGRSYQQGLEAFKQRVAWKKRDGQAVFNVLLKK